jgi:hypothetical protein
MSSLSNFGVGASLDRPSDRFDCLADLEAGWLVREADRQSRQPTPGNGCAVLGTERLLPEGDCRT